MMSDPIADMLTRIRNAGMARLERVEMPLSNVKERIAVILKQEGYIEDFSADRNHPATLSVTLKYDRNHKSAIVGLRRKSRPGRRYYVGHKDIPKVLNGLGVSIVSTSRGVMTDKTARTEGVGGEILCEVW